MPTEIVENYVSAIYRASSNDTNAAISTGQIATSMHVAPGTVTAMLKTLSEQGLATYAKYEGVRLTKEGRLLALKLIRRNMLLQLFLATTLELPNDDELSNETETLKHHVSDGLMDRIDKYLGFPSSDTLGNPIPTSDGQLREEQGVPLTQWKSGKAFRLLRVTDPSPEFLKFLAEENLQPGSHGKLISARSEAGLVKIEINNQTTALGWEAAEKLLVATLE